MKLNNIIKSVDFGFVLLSVILIIMFIKYDLMNISIISFIISSICILVADTYDTFMVKYKK